MGQMAVGTEPISQGNWAANPNLLLGLTETGLCAGGSL